MIFRILLKDIKRRKTMNIILLMFVLIASMFTGSGLSTTVSVMGGLDHFFDMSETGNFLFIASGEGNSHEINRTLEKSDAVKGYRVEKVYTAPTKSVKKENGDDFKTGFPMFLSEDDRCEKNFDINNNEITEVNEGHVYLSKSYMDANEINPGDRITIDIEGKSFDLIVDGIMKDAVFCDVHMMNTQRVVLNERDMRKIRNNPLFRNNGDLIYYIYYIDCDDTRAVDSLLADVEGFEFSGDKEMLKNLYVMDLMISMIMIVLSILLIAVSFVILHFSINFTLEEDFREIGVLKAIGLKNFRIRSMNTVKYTAMAIGGSIAGFFASIPLAMKLVGAVEGKMVVENTAGVIPNLTGALVVTVLIGSYAWHCTGKIKKFSPMDAIRYGSSGERFSGKKGRRIPSHRINVAFHLAVNDILSFPRRYLSILISFFLCTFIVLILDNAENTFKSDAFMDMLFSRGDMVGEFSSADMLKKNYNDAELYLMYERMEKKLAAEGIPCRLSYVDDMSSTLELNGEDHKIRTIRSVRSLPEDHDYTEGSGPQNAGEIAVTKTIADKYGLEIGDVIKADMGKGKKDVVICGFFQSFANTGNVIRVSEEVRHDGYRVGGAVIHFTKDMSGEDQKLLAGRIADICGFEKVSTAAKYCEDTMGVADGFTALKWVMLFISFIVVLLVSILMERSFIASEKNQIALMKAVGFNNRSLVRWHIFRFAIIAEVAVLLAAAASVPMTTVIYSPVFYNMGVAEVRYRYNYLNILLIYPLLIFFETVFMVSLTSLCMRSIKSSDISNLE
ncbi:putative ABC transport system permease protein [Lachnospiraceae bacterium XPB1003]|nr:putative ABC transport system permease protein [Lachnospiraceae bacterium XPB1003]